MLGSVMIKCPDTGTNINTGILADRKTFKSTPVFFAEVLCPVCGNVHEWFAQDAWVAELTEGPTKRRAA